MWQRLSESSACNYASPMGKPSGVADEVARLLANPDMLADMSRQVRTFTMEHTFEHDFSLSTNAIKTNLFVRVEKNNEK
jgi:hypothetical protein